MSDGPSLWWCKHADGRIIEHEATPYERHRGHLRCVEVGPVLVPFLTSTSAEHVVT
jgi:hypothetical protein